MCEAQVARASDFVHLINAMTSLDNANFMFGPGGVSMQAMSMSQVSLVNLTLLPAFFAKYVCQRHLVVGLKIDTLVKALKMGAADSALTIRTDGRECVTLVFESPKTKRTTTVEIKMLEINSDAVDIPDPQPNCLVALPSAEFQSICRDFLAFGINVSIEVTSEYISFKTAGELGTTKVCLPIGSDGVDIRCAAPIVMEVSLAHLNLFTKATPLSRTVVLTMTAKEDPLRIGYTLRDGDGGRLCYYLGSVRDD